MNTIDIEHSWCNYGYLQIRIGKHMPHVSIKHSAVNAYQDALGENSISPTFGVKQ